MEKLELYLLLLRYLLGLLAHILLLDAKVFDKRKGIKELLNLCQFCRTSLEKKLLGDLSSEHRILDLAIFHMYKVIAKLGFLSLT